MCPSTKCLKLFMSGEMSCSIDANGVVSDSYSVRLVSIPVVKLLVYSIRGIRSILVGYQLLCSVIPSDMENVLVQSMC